MRMFFKSFILIPIGMVMTFILHMVIARSLSAESYGSISFILSLVSIIVVIISAGLPVSAPKFLPLYEATQQHCLRAGYLRFSIIWIVIAGAISCLLFITIHIITNSDIYLYGALMIFPMILWIWQRYIALGLDNIPLAIIPRDIIYPFISITGIYLLDINSELSMIILLSSVYLASISIALYRIKVQIHLLPQCNSNRNQLETMRWLKVSSPMMLTSLMVLGLSSWDLLILGLFVDMKDIGQYSVALRLALSAGIAVRIVNVAVSQKISKAYSENDLIGMRKIIKTSFIASAIISIIVATFMAIFSKDLLNLFGEEYVPAQKIMLVLLAGQLISGILGPSQSILNMLGHEKYIASSLLNWSLIALGMYIFTIPLYGMEGAAISTALTIIAMRATQFIKLKKVLLST